jgi:transitional endoplasmic reticulum ATPase
LNEIDGVESKGKELITILTSNHAENINQAMLRPGRLDAVLSIQAPDAFAAEKLIRLYARGLILERESL